MAMKKTILLFSILSFLNSSIFAQIKWTNVDSLYQPLPSSVHVYFTNSPIDTAPFRAYYLIADLKDKKLDFTADTTLNRRLTPSKFYENDNKPLVVVNCTFFSFETNRSLNIVIKDGKILSHNLKPTKGRGVDSTKIFYPNMGAIGINKKRKADVAWIRADSAKEIAEAVEEPIFGTWFTRNSATGETRSWDNFKKWNMQTAVGGGPVLLQKGEIRITNEEERLFVGKAINDKHPRTCMGYTKDGKLIILVIEGRNKSAGGATLQQEAQIFKDLGCWEALNLDGGGSSCLLVNGKESIKPSDVTGERPVPAVFEIFRK
jgi:exopolysaccharide biosynthesis protein